MLTISFLQKLTSKPCTGASAGEKRTLVAHEILSTELTYMNSLSIIQDVFKKPLQASLASNRCFSDFALFCTVFSEVVCKSSLHMEVLLISPGQSRGSLLCNRFLGYHATPPKRSVARHPKKRLRRRLGERLSRKDDFARFIIILFGDNLNTSVSCFSWGSLSRSNKHFVILNLRSLGALSIQQNILV